MRRIKLLSIAFIIGFLLTGTTYAYEADVKYVGTNDYFNTTHHEISQAKESIVLYMYLSSISSYKRNTQPYKLIQSLIEAHKRGIKVQRHIRSKYTLQRWGLIRKRLKKK